jgi:hypothetical protein
VARLRDLGARFLGFPDGQGHAILGEKLEGASGILFLCPKCYATNKGEIGTHSVICWFLDVPAGVAPGPGRWKPEGTSIDDLTFVASPGRTPSVHLTNPQGCGWHGFVRNGDAT